MFDLEKEDFLVFSEIFFDRKSEDVLYKNVLVADYSRGVPPQKQLAAFRRAAAARCAWGMPQAPGSAGLVVFDFSEGSCCNRSGGARANP